MIEETRIIVEAIEGLQQESNLFKEYIFPIVSAFFSAILGAGIAYYFFHYQEELKVEKSKIDNANKWLLLADEALHNLITIKSNYHNRISTSPIQRMLGIPTILFHKHLIPDTFTTLNFIIPKNKKDDCPKWSEIARIRAMINNYNYLQSLWLKRNELERPIKEEVLKKNSKDKAYVNVSLEEIINCVGESKLVPLLDLNEIVIILTDDLILEFSDFLINFPNYIETLINQKKISKYGNIITYTIDSNNKLVDMLKRSPEADYSEISDLFGRSADELNQKYKTGY